MTDVTRARFCPLVNDYSLNHGAAESFMGLEFNFTPASSGRHTIAANVAVWAQGNASANLVPSCAPTSSGLRAGFYECYQNAYSAAWVYTQVIDWTNGTRWTGGATWLGEAASYNDTSCQSPSNCSYQVLSLPNFTVSRSLSFVYASLPLAKGHHYTFQVDVAAYCVVEFDSLSALVPPHVHGIASAHLSAPGGAVRLTSVQVP